MAAHRQCKSTINQQDLQQLAPGDLVWLSIRKASKLAPHWEGEWKITEVKNNVNVKISKGTQSKVIHVNCLRHCFQPISTEAIPSDSVVNSGVHVEHLITHEEIASPSVTTKTRILQSVKR